MKGFTAVSRKLPDPSVFTSDHDKIPAGDGMCLWGQRVVTLQFPESAPKCLAGGVEGLDVSGRQSASVRPRGMITFN